MALLVNIIGAGRLGKTIGHLLVRHQLVRIGAICNRSETSSINAIKFIGQGKYCPTIGELPPADITFITTPDDLIPVTCKELSKNQFIKKGSIVLHCSGSLTSDALISIKEKGCYVASVHPMGGFAKPELSVEQYNGTYCAIEGDNEAFPDVRSLFNSIGSITYEIDKIKKSSYHAAGVFASNYLVTLAQQALSCMKDADVESEVAMHIITNIMRGTVSNLEKTLSPGQSLTGPIKRGDISTITKHLESLTDMEQKRLYSVLGKATLHLTEHNTISKDKIMSALAVEDKCLHSLF
jgi:predicted short-subunit dehydrogenase-like oxidoreductase (DUF2520 family)